MSPPHRFRPYERIKNPADFRRTFDRRRSVSDQLLIIYGAENGLDHPRLGISVSRKKVRRATARNRIKRLIREAFRRSKDDLPFGVDLIVLPRSPEATLAGARQSLVNLTTEVVRRLKLSPVQRTASPDDTQP